MKNWTFIFLEFQEFSFLCSRAFSFSLILFNAFQISPHHSQAQCGHTEYLPMFSTLFIYFFQIKPLNFLYFFCLKNKFRCIHRLLIDVDKSNFFIPKHFSMKFFCERYGEGSGKVQLFRCCADSQFFFQFPKCRFQWFVSCLDVSCRGSIKFSRKRILVLWAFL